LKINYNHKIFRPVSNSENGAVSGETTFHYRQSGRIVTADYAGGDIVQGHLIATVDENGKLDMRYHQVNRAGELHTGICQSYPEILPDGRIRLHETWQWTSGDGSAGSSVVEELPTA
jgi:antitoxin component YwqK of YwqJK toxin-antitoxin module